MDYNKGELQAMKRADLQKMCKKIGIKANMKTEKLVEELMKFSHMTSLESEKCVLECPKNEEIGNKSIATNDEVSQNGREPEKKLSNELTKCSLTICSPKTKKSGNKAPVKASKIPRFNTKPNPMNVDCKTPTTSDESKTPKAYKPKDWSKIHEKQFEKMDSLDVYLSKKRKRAVELGSAPKEVKVLTEGKTTQKNTLARSALANQNQTVVVPKPKEEAVRSKKKRLIFNFTPSTKENVFQTPGTGKRRNTLHQVTTLKPATPFRFTSTIMPFGSPNITPRRKFDLQASLAKPLPYKPYTGKLPTSMYAQNATKDKFAAKKTTAGKSHQRDVKAVKTTTRSERRERQQKRQSQARESAVSRRRGMMK